MYANVQSYWYTVITYCYKSDVIALISAYLIMFLWRNLQNMAASVTEWSTCLKSKHFISQPIYKIFTNNAFNFLLILLFI